MSKTAVFALLLTVHSAFAQQPLGSSRHYFSFLLPPGWTFEKIDTIEAVVQFDCFNADSTILAEVFALKTETDIDREKFLSFVTSENGVIGSWGHLTEQDAKAIQRNGVAGIEKNFIQTSPRGRKMNVCAIIFTRANYGYVLSVRARKDLNGIPEVASLASSFSIQKPRSAFSKLLPLAVLGICLYGLYAGAKKTWAWTKPLNVGALLYCAAVFIGCLGVLIAALYSYEHINIWLGMVAGALLWAATAKMPDTAAVEKAFSTARLQNTASGYRQFCQNYSSARRYYREARHRMREMMDDVVRKYRGVIQTQDTTITRAILAMFEYVKATDKFEVSIVYQSQNRITDYTEILKQKGIKILPASPAFTPEKNRRREENITTVIRYAFSKITPEDILSFTTEGAPESERIAFNIEYGVNTSGDFYYHTAEENLPEDKRTWFTGVEFKWSIAIRVPNRSDVFRLQFDSKPATSFKTQGTETEKVYEAMADSAFNDFCRVFIQQSGLSSALTAA
ncbi:hypothetical protein HUU05_00820 [candidate division KSB1 bacterium]|nr:hypothetical protein [candidate division KSB1 bacterium]